MPENSRKGYKDRVGLRLGEMRKVYPGRVLRLYSNLPTRNPNLCTLLCGSSPDVFYCNVSNIMGNLAVRSHGVAWRFVPLGDPTVATFLSRDLDSPLIPREVGAVSVWERSNKTFHFIRDSEYHGHPIQAGMWGAKTSQVGLEERQGLLQRLLEVTHGINHYSRSCEDSNPFFSFYF